MDRYIAERAIKKNNFSEEILSLEGAQDALDYLLEHADMEDALPEIIFLDIRMPGLDGFDFLDRFEKLPDGAKKRIIIIMLTSSLNEDDHKKAMNNKFVRQFINKPLSPEELNNIVRLTQ